MTQANPETRFNELLSLAVGALRRRPSDFELRHLQHEASRLTKVDLAGALEVRAHVEAVRNNLREADDLYGRAISASNDYTGSILRYMVVLSATGQGHKVRELVRRYWELIKTSPEALRAARKSLMGSGWIKTADTAREELERMGIELDEERDEFCGVEDALNEDQIAEAVIFSRCYLRERGAQPVSVRVMAVPIETGASTILYQFVVDRSPEEAAEIEWDMFAALHDKAFVAETGGSVLLTVAPQEALPDAHH